MKYLSVLAMLTVLSSCGKRTQYIENNYDDSNVQAKLKLHDALITNLDRLIQENRTESLNYVNTKIGVMQTLINGNKISFVKPCGSSENLMLINNTYYAIYMVSNNYGTYLGTLSERTRYQTTDSTKKQFEIDLSVNGHFKCDF